MKIKLLSILILSIGVIAFVLGCGSDNEPEEITEIFTGTLEFDNDTITIGHNFIDTVKLTITGTKYSFITEVHTASVTPKLCDVTGNVSGFGGNSAIFSPGFIDSTSCNARDVIKGTFSSVFTNDSLILNKFDTTNNLFYELRLGK